MIVKLIIERSGGFSSITDAMEKQFAEGAAAERWTSVIEDARDDMRRSIIDCFAVVEVEVLDDAIAAAFELTDKQMGRR